MKTKNFYLIFLLLLLQKTYSQGKTFDDDSRETINWINKKFSENKKWRSYFLDRVERENNEPILIMTIEPGNCSSVDTCRIPLRKIKSMSYEIYSIRNQNDTYELSLKTKNDEEIVWFKKDEFCGQIGNEMTISLNPSIESNDLKNRILNALNHLMFIYENKNREKF